MRTALAPLMELGLVTLSVTPDARLTTVQRALRRAEEAGRPIRAWHYIGHGHIDPHERQGRLDLEGSGGSVAVSGFHLGTLLRDHAALRLVVINACESGAADATDALSSIGGALVERGISTVVSMQFPISDGAAITFSGELYASLADGLAVDAAITEARRAVFFSDHGNEWITPVVFSRGYPDESLIVHPDSRSSIS